MKQILIILLMLFNSSSYETQKYELIMSEDEFEIRFYPAALKAKVISTRNANGNFYKLFQFISGNNSKGEKIEMTTPVYMKEDNKGAMMEFVLPSTLNENNASQPLSQDVELYMDQGGIYASVSYGGYSNNSKRNKYTSQLNNKLEKMNIEKMSLCLNFVNNNNLIDKIIFGVDSLNQIKSILNCQKIKKINFDIFKTKKTKIIDPRNWEN